MKMKCFIPQKFCRDGKKLKENQQSYHSPFYQIRREIDDLFSSFYDRNFFSPLTEASDSFTPKFDVMETDSSYIVKAEIPGIEEKDINVSLRDKILKIEGKKEHQSETKDMRFHRIESCYGSFERSLELPDNADEDNINAKFKNGVLEISISKREKDDSLVKQITINT